MQKMCVKRLNEEGKKFGYPVLVNGPTYNKYRELGYRFTEQYPCHLGSLKGRVFGVDATCREGLKGYKVKQGTANWEECVADPICSKGQTFPCSYVKGPNGYYAPKARSPKGEKRVRSPARRFYAQ